MNQRASWKGVSIRPKAVADIENHAVCLEENAPPEIAKQFRWAIMTAIEEIVAMPAAGAPRQQRNPRLLGLRMKVLPEFRNYLIFYTTEAGVDIIRVFHGAQNIQSLLEEELNDE